MKIIKVNKPSECPWNIDDYCANPDGNDVQSCPDWSSVFPENCPLEDAPLASHNPSDPKIIEMEGR